MERGNNTHKSERLWVSPKGLKLCPSCKWGVEIFSQLEKIAKRELVSDGVNE
jgi:hypothetical protein